MSHLVISFTGALHQIKNGKLTALELSDSLFYFGCVRAHAFNPGADANTNELNFVSEDPAEQQRIHKILTTALRKAEKKGRVAWRSMRKGNTYKQLNALLKKNGYAPLSFEQYNQHMYNYPTVQQASEEQNLPLKVVWRG